MIKVTPEFGIIIRLSSLSAKKLNRDNLIKVMGNDTKFDQDNELISFGPLFGQEALDELIERLQEFGLEYWNDFFELTADIPDWCILNLEMNDI